MDRNDNSDIDYSDMGYSGIFFLFIAAFIVAGAAKSQSEQRWAADAQARACHIIATDTGFFFKKVTWECPDGQVHTRCVIRNQ